MDEYERELTEADAILRLAAACATSAPDYDTAGCAELRALRSAGWTNARIEVSEGEITIRLSRFKQSW